MKTYNRNALILLFSVTYFVSYLTRINFSAVISEMEIATGFSKQLLSMSLTGSFITYGAGQILSGILGDRHTPKKLVLFGLFLTVAMNLTLPFCSSPWLMTAVWSVNGFAQAFMWPPIVRLLIALFSKVRYTKSVVRVSWGSSIASIVVYLLSPIIITFTGWKGVFFLGAFCGIVMMILWQAFCPNIKPQKRAVQHAQSADAVAKTNIKVLTPLFFAVGLIIVICGMLRDGISTWTPSLISESFNLSSSSGILSGAVMPIFGMVCYEVALSLYRKRFSNPVYCAALIFLIGIISAAVLILALEKSAVLTLISIALLNGTMHGANLMFTGMVPSFYANTGKVSTVSGVLNSFVYIGAAVSTYGIAIITESFGWKVTVISWLALTVLGGLLAFILAKPWLNEVKKQ